MPSRKVERESNRRGLASAVLVLGLPALLLVASGAAAQRLQTRNHTLDDGLPNSAVLDVAQDTSGRLWILHRVGVSVFDGAGYHTYTTADGLPSNPFGALAVDAAGHPWVVGRGGRPVLHSLRDGTWTQVTPKAPRSGREMVLLATSVTGGRTLVAIGSFKDGLWLWDGERWHAWSAEDGVLPTLSVRGLSTFGGRLAVAASRGLCFVDGLPDGTAVLDCSIRDREPRLRAELLGSVTTAAHGDEPERLWVLSTEGLAVLEDDGGIPVLRSFVSLDLPIFPTTGPGSVAVHPGGDVYLGHPAWVYLVTSPFEAGRQVLRLGLREGLVAHGATRLLVDREEQVWVATLRGLSQLAGRRFVSYSAEHGLAEDEVSAVAETSPGRIVLAHDTGLSFLAGDRPAGRLAFDVPAGVPPAGRRVLDMVVTPSGDLFLAALRRGLLRLRPDGTLEKVASFPRGVVAVELDGEGRLWVLTEYDLWERRGDAFVRDDLSDSTSSYLRWLSRDGTGAILVAGIRGLYYRHDGRWHVATSTRDEMNNVYGTAVLPDGRLVVASATGLLELRGEGAERRLEEAGVPGGPIRDPIYSLLVDGEGRLWCGTDDGVLVLEDGAVPRRLSVAHGLVGRETNRGALVADHRGRVWIGTDRGASVYDPSQDRPRTAAPRVELLDVTAGLERFPLDGELDLAPFQNSLTFRFRSVYLAREIPAVYRYRLVGQEDWQGPVELPTGELRYTNLRPGRSYRLEVRAGWPEGPWSPAAVSAEVRIARPLWLQPWLYVFVAAVLGGLIYGAHAFRTRALRVRSEALEAVNERLQAAIAERDLADAERERLIAALEAKNKELERFSYTVSHDLKSPLVTIRGFLGFLKNDIQGGRPGSLEDVQRIEDAAGKMGELLDELLELSRLGKVIEELRPVDLGGVARDVVDLLAGRLEERSVEVVVRDALPAVLADRPRLVRVFQNLVDNAVKYMGDQASPRVEIGVWTGEDDIAKDFVVCYVRDNGSGIAPEDQEKVFSLFERLDSKVEGTGLGLGMVRRIVALHGGSIWVESEGRGRGAAFCFTLPRMHGRPARGSAQRSTQ